MNECEQQWIDTDMGKLKPCEENTYSLGDGISNECGEMVE